MFNWLNSLNILTSYIIKGLNYISIPSYIKLKYFSVLTSWQNAIGPIIFCTICRLKFGDLIIKINIGSGPRLPAWLFSRPFAIKSKVGKVKNNFSAGHGYRIEFKYFKFFTSLDRSFRGLLENKILVFMRI